MLTIVIPSIGSYSDFVAAIANLPVEGDVWFATTVNSTFQAQFISHALDVSVSFASAATPSSFSADFPSAHQFNSGFTLAISHGGIFANGNDYSDFKFLVDYLEAGGIVFESIDTVQGSSFVSIYALNKQMSTQIFCSQPGSSLPSTFATDFPNAVAMTALSPVAMVF